VFVETREEPEAVLSGEVSLLSFDVGARPAQASDRHRDAPGLASAQLRLFLEDGDAEAALDQFVGGTHPGDTTAEDRDLGTVTVGERFQRYRFDWSLLVREVTRGRIVSALNLSNTG
jgi:hypothetical protein